MKINERILHIKGIHCNSCVNKIESKLNLLDGVEYIKVNLAENRAIVKFDPEEVDLGKIKSEINSLGYCTCNKKPGVCKKTKEKNKKISQGLIYGLIPHIGCIAFIVGSILGVTVLMQFFRPLLMNRYIFHILILISLLFATGSSTIYLRKNDLLNWKGLKRKRKYIATMFGSTVGINLLLFMIIFPLLANVSMSASPTALMIATEEGIELSTMEISVDIPCPGHSFLISNELKTIEGVSNVQFKFPNKFDIKYDSAETTRQEILSLEVFKTYEATVLEPIQQDIQLLRSQPPIQPKQENCCGCGTC